MASNLVSMFLEAAATWPQRPMLCWKARDGEDWTRLSYAGAREAFYRVATQLLKWRLSGKHIALFSDTTPEWLIADFACQAVGAVDVPRGLSTSETEMAFILKHSGSLGAIVQNEAVYRKLPRAFSRSRPILCFQRFTGAGRNVVFFEDVSAKGPSDRKAVDRLIGRIQPKHLASIVYTSGTTGNPKGVMLSHANFMHNVRVGPKFLTLKDETYLSLLPIWHAYERTCEYLCVSIGTTFYYTNKRRFKDDMGQVKPTIFPSAPAVWIAVYNAFMDKIAKSPLPRRLLARFLIQNAVRHVRARRVVEGKLIRRPQAPVDAGTVLSNTVAMHRTAVFYHLAQRLVFKHLTALTGGRLRRAISGGGALPDNIDDFFEAANFPLMNGYGLTETAPIISTRTPETNVRGTIGAPLTELTVQIRDLETRKPLPVGEIGFICVKGPSVMQGYYKNPKETRRILGKDGYLNTGDIGFLDEAGLLAITGRRKEVIVLISGENIMPNVVEDELMKCREIAQCMLVGSDKKVPAALIHPNEELLLEYAQRMNIQFGDYHELLKHPQVVEHFRLLVKQYVNDNTARIQPFERIGHFALIEKPFTEGEELTNTQKLRRDYIAAKYKHVIDELYGRHGYG
ncbi:MAG: long-chain fatty acid--CoA ligase [Spirochaetes bacterium]|nr:long-chain fatty acid--CoA ligase [Spirochaetota bacterium]